MSQRYNPIPSPPEYSSPYLYGELRKLKEAIDQIVDGHMEKSNVVPDRPRDGDIRYADGTNWNPGSGEGVYVYYNSTWNKL